MKKERTKVYGAYLTVEASLVMPVVFACYVLIVLLLGYIYERCIWEQNACRLSVWKIYVEGFAGRSLESAEEISEEEVCKYVLGCLQREESVRYLFGQDTSADISIRGEAMKVGRGICYPQFGDAKYELVYKSIILNPREYIRTAKLLEKHIMDDKGEKNDKK